MGNGKTDHRTIRQIDRTLHKALSEGTTPHYDTTILILYGTCHNLCCRRRVAVHQHHDLTILEHTFTISYIVHTRHLTTFCINNQITLLQKLFRDIYCSLQITTSILLQIEYQMLHPFSLQLVETLQKLLMRRCTKAANTDIANAWTNHIGGID